MHSLHVYHIYLPIGCRPTALDSWTCIFYFDLRRWSTSWISRIFVTGWPRTRSIFSTQPILEGSQRLLYSNITQLTFGVFGIIRLRRPSCQLDVSMPAQLSTLRTTIPSYTRSTTGEAFDSFNPENRAWSREARAVRDITSVFPCSNS